MSAKKQAAKRSEAPAPETEAKEQEAEAPTSQSIEAPAPSGLAGTYTMEPTQTGVKVRAESLPEGSRFRARVFGARGGHYMVCDFADAVAFVPAPPGVELVVFVKEVDASNVQGEWVKLGEVTTVARQNSGLSKPKPSR